MSNPIHTRLGAEEAVAYVTEQGVVLVSAQGRARSLVEAILGEPVKGSCGRIIETPE